MTQNRKLERGEEVTLLVRVKATVIDRASGHGRCYELRLDQRDFTAETNRTVWIDDAEIDQVIECTSNDPKET